MIHWLRSVWTADLEPEFVDVQPLDEGLAPIQPDRYAEKLAAALRVLGPKWCLHQGEST